MKNNKEQWLLFSLLKPYVALAKSEVSHLQRR